MQKVYLPTLVCLLFSFTSLQAQVTFSSGTIPPGIPTTGIPVTVRWLPGDFDNDGDVDVLYQSGSTSGANIYYLENDGSGSYTSTAANGSGTFGSGPFNGITFTIIANTIGVPVLHIADYDHDGDIDIFELNTSSARFLRNDGGSWTVASPPSGFPSSVVAPIRWVMGDFDNDGDVDVLYQNTNTVNTGIFCLINNGSGSFTSIAANGSGTFSSGPFNGITFVNIGSNYGQYIADWDDDGDMDVFELSMSSSRLLVNTAGSYSVGGAIPANFPTSSGVPIRWVQADYDGDGDIDVLYQTSTTPGTGIYYLQNNGSGNFTSIAASAGTFSSGPFSGLSFTFTAPIGNPVLHPVDVDNDGDIDLLELSSSATRALLASGAAPRISSSMPADEDGSFDRSSNFTLNFNQAVTAGTGNIYIRKTSDNSIAQTIVANGPDVSGSGTATIVINPPADLDALTSYYITFDLDAFSNSNGVAFGQLDHVARQMKAITGTGFLNFTTSNLAPVTLTYFTARFTNGGDVRLDWQTTYENNSSHFIVEKSSDGVNFHSIGRINAKGNSSTSSNYSFTDRAPSGSLLYYRLLQYDLDGRMKDYGIRSVNTAANAAVRVYPNASGSELLVEMPAQAGAVNIRLINASGQTIFSKRYTAGSGSLRIPVTRVRTGIYSVIVASEQIKKTIRVLIRH